MEETWRRFAPGSTLKRAEAARFQFSWSSVGTEGFSLVDYDLAADVHSAIAPDDQFFTCRVVAPRGQVISGRRILDADDPWASTGSEIEAEWAGRASVQALIFGLDFAQRMARQWSGDSGLTLAVHDARPASKALGQYWNAVFEHCRHALLDGGGRDEPIIEAEVRRYAMRAAFAVFTTSFADAIDRPVQRRPAESTVRHAQAYMDEHAHEPITVDDVAAAVHISTRGLQHAFKRSIDQTPMQYLRRVRLEGAHADLHRDTRESGAAIALRWGFAHPARFAQYYRAQYGHAPRDRFRRCGSPSEDPPRM